VIDGIFRRRVPPEATALWTTKGARQVSSVRCRGAYGEMENRLCTKDLRIAHEK